MEQEENVYPVLMDDAMCRWLDRLDMAERRVTLSLVFRAQGVKPTAAADLWLQLDNSDKPTTTVIDTLRDRNLSGTDRAWTSPTPSVGSAPLPR